MFKKEIEKSPYIHGMTLEDGCWVSIMIDSKNGTTINYYNPKEDPNAEELSFKEFAEDVFSSEFQFSIRDGACIEFKETTAKASGVTSKEYEDYDEETLRNFTTVVSNGQIINVYKEIKIDSIPLLIQEAKKELELIERDGLIEGAETKSLNKDVYAHYGVKRSNFM
jgi:hypothetical protein